MGARHSCDMAGIPFALETLLELLAVQPGNVIANLFAALLLAGLIGGVFLLFGRPLWPQRHAQMVVLLPIDTMATRSVRKACAEPCLPARFDLKLAPVRPSAERRRGNQSAPRTVD
ncbi:hypothetical protein [Mesorhizobium sp. B3-1-6]|uniref:hypothetical protein n=1 Tax=Mesorhizobium sp. B3-1-6 TaxID=2589895 RepID=UPI001FF07504|nr:hypothetical protein [Mesorhizobium sp. B3-1-6]